MNKCKPYLNGGNVNGPGTATSDSIHAKLSDGEFVVKAKVVQKPGVLDFLKELNNSETNSDNHHYKSGGEVNSIDDSLFEDVPYQDNSTFEAAPSDDSLFEDTPHPDAKPKLDVSQGEAGAIGALSGATLNTSDEIMAPFMAAAGMATGLPDESPDESTWEKYKRLTNLAHDVANEREAAAIEQHPMTHMAGSIAGGFAAPGLGAAKLMKAAGALKGASGLAKIAAGAGAGAGIGGIAGFGAGSGMDARLKGLKQGAAIGTVFGGAIPLATETASFLGNVGKGIGKVLGGEPMGQAYTQGTKGHNILKETAKVDEYGKLYDKSRALVDDISDLFSSTNKKINKALEETTSEGSVIDLKPELDATFSKLKDLRQTEDGAKYANDIESELKHILGIKKQANIPQDAPEGFIFPKEETVDFSNLTPQQAQDIKQVMYSYGVKGNESKITAQTGRQAKVAGELSYKSKNKLAEISPDLDKANSEFAALSTAVERLKLNSQLLPEQQARDVAKLLNTLEKENITGYEAQKVIDDVVENIKLVNPEVAAKYNKDLNDISKRLDLIGQLRGGTNFGRAGILKRTSIAGGNIAGRAVNKIQNIPGVKPTTTFVQKVLENPVPIRGLTTASVQDTENIKESRKIVEPHVLQRQVTAYVEQADPETLIAQANQIRQQYGEQGERLAVSFENMAKNDPKKRRLDMFSILGNPAYKHMLGLTKEEVK